MSVESQLQRLIQRFYTTNDEYQDNFTELPYQLSARTASPIERFVVE